MNRVRAQEPGSGTSGPSPESPGGVYIIGGITDPVGYLTTLILVSTPPQVLDYT